MFWDVTPYILVCSATLLREKVKAATFTYSTTLKMEAVYS
jgi:hypothetical protein